MSVVINNQTCICCNLSKPSNQGKIVNYQNFVCYTCITTNKIQKQNNWNNTLQTQQSLLNSAISTLQTTDVLDIPNCNIQIQIIGQIRQTLFDLVNS